MKITYDPEADAVYIKLREGEYATSDEIRKGIIIDWDKDNEIIGIEILSAKKKLGSVTEVCFEYSEIEEKW